MAETSKNKIYYNDDENSVADVLTDMKKMAESTDKAIENSKYDDAQIKKDISDAKKEQSLKDAEQDNKIIELQNEKAELEKELKEAQEDFYQNSIRGQASGEYIHVEDSSNCRARIGIGGNSEQETRSGKNKIDLAKCQVKTSNGVTSTYNKENNSITFNGTCTVDNTAFHIFENWKNDDDNNVLIKNNSTLLAQYVSGNVTGYSRFRLSDENWQDKIGLDLTILNSTNKKIYNTYSKSDTTIKYLSFRFEKGTVLNNFTIQLMLTDTVDTEYEMYGASPSPNYLSEVQTVGSNGSVKVTKCNKNIMPINIGTNYAYTSSGIKHLNRENGTEITRFIVKKGQIIKVGLKLISKPINDTTFSFYFKSNDNTIGSFAHMERNEFELNQIYEREHTAIEDGEFFIKIWGSPTPDIFEFQLWAELDNLTEYEQHEEQSYIVPTQQSFKSIRDIRDTFIKKDVKWYERHNINRRIFDGTTNKFIGTSGTANNLFVTNTFEDGNIIVPLTYGKNVQHFNNYFQIKYSSDEMYQNANYVGSAIRPSDDMVMGFGKESEINTVDKANAWLKAKYDAGVPLYVDYLLETPIDIECTEEQSKILDELNNARTYKNVTNITTDSKAILSLDYAKDLETLLNNTQALAVNNASEGV